MQLKYGLLGSLALISIIILTGCSAFEDPSKRATANAEDTAIAATLSVVEFQNETMVALRGTADQGMILSQQMTQSASNPVSANNNNSNGTVFGGSTPIAIDGGAPGGTQPTRPPQPTSIPVPTATQATAIYSRATIADELDDAFCALNEVDTFDIATVDTIYFVIYVQQLKPGVTFDLRVDRLSGGRVTQTPNFWTSDTLYESTCIYYGIDSEDMGGQLSVDSFKAILFANTVEVASAEFYIVGNQ